MNITSRERGELKRLLGDYQAYLESVIDCHVIPGTNPPKSHSSEHARIVVRAQVAWQKAETWVKKLEGV